MKDKREYEDDASPVSTETYVIKVNINCCRACPIRAKKALQKLTGVDSVVVFPEKRLIYVTGKVDPTELINKLSKWGKKAQLLSCKKEPMNEDHHPQDGLKKAQIRKEKKKSMGNSCCKTTNEDYCCSHSDFGHEPENYVPPKEYLDISNICRDPFCKIHVRNTVIKNGPPSLRVASRGPMVLHHPRQNIGHCYGDGIGSYPPVPVIPNVGYYHSRMPQYYPMMAPPASEYCNLRRPLPRFDYFSNENSSSSCSIM